MFHYQKHHVFKAPGNSSPITTIWWTILRFAQIFFSKYPFSFYTIFFTQSTVSSLVNEKLFPSLFTFKGVKETKIPRAMYGKYAFSYNRKEIF